MLPSCSGVVAEKTSEELFTLDIGGSEEIKQKHGLKKSKPLRSDQILAQRSAIPGVDSRKRPNSQVTDGIVEPNSKRNRSDWVTHAEWLRLKKLAKAGEVEIKGTDGLTTYDPWADAAPAPTKDKLGYLPKPQPKVAPSTLKLAPLSLAANGKSIPAVPNPDAGTSYNPSFEDWDRLLVKEGEREVEAEKQRLADEKADEERLARIAVAQAEGADDMAAHSDDESAWEGFESEYEGAETKTKRPERKNQVQRNKIKRRKEAERKEKADAKMKKRDQQAAEIKAIAKVVEEKERAKQQLLSLEDSSEEGDAELLRKKSFGRLPYVTLLPSIDKLC